MLSRFDGKGWQPTPPAFAMAVTVLLLKPARFSPMFIYRIVFLASIYV